MLKGLWIRLDIPYSKDANKMRAVLAYCDPEKQGSEEIIKASDCRNIPEAVKKIFDQAESSDIMINPTITLVYPLDSRHDLAGYVRDEADKRKINFSRHIPDIMKLPVDFETGYENFDTGSTEDTFDFDRAKEMIIQLNEEANESFNSSDFLEAMGPLRHALWLALRHFGWKHPACVYTLRNLGYTLTSTGNKDNENEVIALVLKLIYLWQLKPPDASVWKGSENLLDELASLCCSINSEETGVALHNLKTELLK